MEAKITSENRIKEGSQPLSKKPEKTVSGTGQAQRLDTYESSVKDKPFGNQMMTGSKDGIHWNGAVLELGTLTIHEPDPDADGINWKELEHYFSNATVTMDNADQVEGTIEGVASMYLAVKEQLKQKFSGREDKLSEKMEQLNSLFQRAKDRIISSYRGTVGSFYEQLGNKGASSKMGESLSVAIEQKVAEIEEHGKKYGLLNNTKNPKDFTYQVRAAFLQAGMLAKRENMVRSGKKADVSDNTKNAESEYSLTDLKAAGMIAKAATKMNPKELSLMSDKELGLQLALRYMKTAHLLGSLGVGEKMSGMILSSFETFLDQHSGGALTNKGKASGAYHCAVSQYQSTKDMEKAIALSAKKYLGNEFFTDFYTSSYGVGTTKYTRYRFELAQFMNSLQQGSLSEAIKSIAGNQTPFMMAYA